TPKASPTASDPGASAGPTTASRTSLPSRNPSPAAPNPSSVTSPPNCSRASPPSTTSYSAASPTGAPASMRHPASLSPRTTAPPRGGSGNRYHRNKRHGGGRLRNRGRGEDSGRPAGGPPNPPFKRRRRRAWGDITERAGLAVLDDTASALFVDLRNTGRQDVV